MEELICYCKEVSKKTVENAIKQGAKNLEEIKEKTAACTGNECKTKNPSGICCSGDILKLLGEKLQSNSKCSCCE